ncbi:protein SPT2 homolog [Aulostomus maculatus]
MMDFDNILDIASQNKGTSNVQKRYSLQVGPPKKDPKSKGVNPAAVQALLKRKNTEAKQKALEMKKQKVELLAKRVELKSDRKARAMASRTKDNFHGYNGIPVVDVPKKKRSKQELETETSPNVEGFRNCSVDPEDDEDNYEYEQTDSEAEQEPEPLRPGKTSGVSRSGSKPKKPGGPPKSGQAGLNFADLLKLAEQKQFEPVDLKPKVVKKAERLRTAEEIRELEMERKAKRRDKDIKPDRQRVPKSQSGSSLVRKNISEKEQKNCRPHKPSTERPSGTGKKSHPTPTRNKGHSSSKPALGDRDRERPKLSHGDRDRCRTSLSSSSGAINNKVPSKATSSQVPVKQGGPRPSSSHKSSVSSDLSFKKESSSSVQGRPSGFPGSRPPGTSATGQKSQHGVSQQNRPIQGSSVKQGPTIGGHKLGKGEPQRSGSNPVVKSSGNPLRPSSVGPPKAGSQPPPRPAGPLQARAGGVPQSRPGGSSSQGHPGGRGVRPLGNGPGRGGYGGPVPGQSRGNLVSGPGRPKCTVVSETISSKNVGGPRPGVLPRPGMPHRGGMVPRGGFLPHPLNRPPGPMLPPITSAYKRKYEDEEDEYDSEMDDFIDDGEEEQEEISKHIKEIFGYDRSRYKDESDYALKFMESSWRDMQKEEARSLRMAVQEDLEEAKKEEEEMKRQNAKKSKLK